MRERFKGVPVEKKYLELSEEEKLCSVCGTPLKEIGEEFVRRELVFVPAKLKVYEYYSKSYECSAVQGFRIFRSSKRKRWQSPYALWNGFCWNGCLAMYQKFCNGLPYYRQEKDWKQYGGDHQSYYGKLVIRNSEAFFFLCMNTSTGNFWNVDS